MNATALKDELQAFTRKVTGAGRDAYGATGGAHDDLVIAVVLAKWRMEMRGGAIWQSSIPGRIGMYRKRRADTGRG